MSLGWVLEVGTASGTSGRGLRSDVGSKGEGFSVGATSEGATWEALWGSATSDKGLSGVGLGPGTLRTSVTSSEGLGGSVSRLRLGVRVSGERLGSSWMGLGGAGGSAKPLNGLEVAVRAADAGDGLGVTNAKDLPVGYRLVSRV